MLEAYAAAFVMIAIGFGGFFMLAAWLTTGIAGLSGYPIDETLGNLCANLSITALCGGGLIAAILFALSLVV